MSTELLKVKESLTLTKGSLLDVIKQRQAQRTTMLLIDYSGSMDSPAEQGSNTRKIDALRGIAQQLKQDLPQLPQIGFGRRVGFIETVPEPDGMTPLTEGMEFAQQHHAGHLIVVSDGMPDDPQGALAVARTFGGPIDVFYVGPRPSEGEDFLRQLSQASGGQFASTTLAQPKQLETRIRGLLGAGKGPK